MGPETPRRKELEDTSVPLNDQENADLDRRRRAAELQGSSISPVEVPSQRAELEALREKGNAPAEMDREFEHAITLANDGYSLSA